jgi:hypothetical protein
MSSSKQPDKRRPLPYLRKLFSKGDKSDPGQPTSSTSASPVQPPSYPVASSATPPTTEVRALALYQSPTTVASAMEPSSATHENANPGACSVSLPAVALPLAFSAAITNAVYPTLSHAVVSSAPTAQTVAIPSPLSSSSVGGFLGPAPESPAAGSSNQPAKKAGNQQIVEVLSSSRTLLGMTEKALDGLPIYGPKAIFSVLTETLKVAQVSNVKLYLRG